jgi:hypothetical protein
MPSFYNNVRANTYKNLTYALNIVLEEFLSRKYLERKLDRVIYSSTDFALVKRSSKEQWNNANLPFINYRVSNKENNGERNWATFEGASQGVFIDELKSKINFVPISISYDCTYWTNRFEDYNYISDLLLEDNALETKVPFELQYNDTLVRFPGIMSLNLDTSPQYSETDWLEKNNMHSISINPTVQTFLPITRTSSFGIPKTVIHDFYSNKSTLIETDILEIDEYAFIENYFT